LGDSWLIFHTKGGNSRNYNPMRFETETEMETENETETENEDGKVWLTLPIALVLHWAKIDLLLILHMIH